MFPAVRAHLVGPQAARSGLFGGCRLLPICVPSSARGGQSEDDAISGATRIDTSSPRTPIPSSVWWLLHRAMCVRRMFDGGRLLCI